MNSDQNESSNGASGVSENSISVEGLLAKLESGSDPNSKILSKKLQNSSLASFDKVKKDAKALQSSIKAENERISEIPKEEILNEIMKRMELDAMGRGFNLDMDDIHEIGTCLIKNFCSIEMTAREMDIPPARLRYLITHSDELQVYYEIAHAGIKSLTDEQVIRQLQAGDPDTIKMVFNKMYAGRHRGGYNVAELGTVGYDDPLSEKLAAKTEEDRDASQAKVIFNFVEREIRTDAREIESVTDAIDADYEMVEPENLTGQNELSNSQAIEKIKFEQKVAEKSK